MSEQRMTPNLKDTEGPVINFPRFPCSWSIATTLGSSQSVSGASDTSKGAGRCPLGGMAAAAVVSASGPAQAIHFGCHFCVVGLSPMSSIPSDTLS